MKGRARILLAVVPLTLLVVGMVAFSAGSAVAGGGKSTNGLNVDITCPATTANVGDTLSYDITVTNATHAAAHDVTVSDTQLNTFTGVPEPFNQNDTYTSTVTYTVTAADQGTTITEQATASGTQAADAVSGSSDICSTSVAAAATSPAASTSGGQAATGFNPLPYALASLLLLGMGGSFVLVSRRR